MSRTSLRRWAGPALAGSLALVGSALPTPAAAEPGSPSAVFVNELHYDNAGTDTGEFVEVRVPAGTDLGQWSIVLYNGNTATAATTYGTTRVLGAGPASGAPVVLDYPTDGLQNGERDGLALVGPGGTVVQLLSYEGVFTAGNGPAAGMTSTDIGVAEVGTTPVGQSLQLRGTGSAAGDFTWAAAAPATKGAPNTGQVLTAPGGPAAPVAACPTALTAVEGEAASAQVSATDADSRVTSVTTSPAVPGISLSTVSPSTAAGQPATATLGVAAGTAVGRYPVAVTFATGVAPVQSVSCTVVVSVADALTIAEVQGAGRTSPYEDELVAVRGVVVGDYQAPGQFGGFYLQSLVPDADPLTSEGIRVFVGGTAVAVGDLVQVVGTVDEFASSSSLYSGSETQLDSRSTVTRLGTAPLPAPAPVTLPFAETVAGVDGQERYEGMLVTLTNSDLVATDLFTLGRFGEVSLTTGELLYIPTTAAEAAANDRDRITLDDGLSGQNLPTLPYTVGGDGATLPRAGDRVVDPVTGVLTFAFGEWRIVPAVGTLIDFERSEPRPATPEDVGGDVQVASFNVLNYFVDLTRDNPAARGADTAAELARQQAKLVAAVTGLDADVVGLIEIANDDGDALRNLVDALNAVQPGTADDYTAVQAPALNAPTALGGTYGTDAIRQAIIYRASVVTPVGPPPSDPALLNPADPLFPQEPVFDRPPAVQTFQPVGGNHEFTVVVNHFKSKGSTNAQCGPPDPFGGNCDDLRERQALALVELVEDLGARKNAVLLGDFNSYESELPISILEEAGYVSAVADQPREERISYSFDGEFGSLDYAFLSKSLAKQLTGADIWNINSFEAVALNYNDFNQRGLYRPDAFASSDHDPVLVGLALLPGSRGRWTAEQAQAGRG